MSVGKIVSNQEFNHVIELIENARTRAYRAVNTALIDLYWDVGKYLSQQIATREWGKGVVDTLAIHIRQYDPAIRGFSAQNLWRMKQFYETYKDSEKLSSLLRELTWSGNLVIEYFSFSLAALSAEPAISALPRRPSRLGADPQKKNIQ
ncbi:MAG: DUF1016 domain-containing protein [Euryarchaeota archaeon]|nr:DUF1016 domain-containing protein [Euryarchaeota archaeon]